MGNKTHKLMVIMITSLILIFGSLFTTQAMNRNLSLQYKGAYDATMKAIDTRVQKDLTNARALVDSLYEVVRGSKDEYLATTLSSILDPVQHEKLVQLMSAIELAERTEKQRDINVAKNLIIDMPVVWRNAYSSYIDKIQQRLINQAVALVDKAKSTSLYNDVKAAQEALDEIKTAIFNFGVVNWAKEYEKQLKDIEITYEDIGAVETTVYSNDEGQFLKLKVDGVEMLSSELVELGYEVTFYADEYVFRGMTNRSVTGELDKGSLTHLGNTSDEFSYKVVVTKGDKVYDSSYVKVKVYNKYKTAKVITSGNIATEDLSTIKSGVVIVGEIVTINNVTANLLDGRNNVDLLSLDGHLSYESSDENIATVTKRLPDNMGIITLQKPGKVTITIKSGDAAYDLNLEVLSNTAKREICKVVYESRSIDLINNSQYEMDMYFKDQFGEAYNTKWIEDKLIIETAVYNGKSIATAKIKEGPDYPIDTRKQGKGIVKIISDEDNTGHGNITIKNSKGGILATIPVEVKPKTSTPTISIIASGEEIDLNPLSENESINFKLSQYINESYLGDVNLISSDYRAEIYDVDGRLITAEATITDNVYINVNRDDLIFEGENPNTSNIPCLSNYETGIGLIKIVDDQGRLIAHSNFRVIDSSPNLISASLLQDVEFNLFNESSLRLSHVLADVKASSSAYDGVIRYEILDSNNIVIYFDSSANPNGYSYADEDILLGIITANAKDVNNIEFINSPLPNKNIKDSKLFYSNEDIIINSKMVSSGERIQLDVIKRGDISIARTIGVANK